jgi:hypothetical protein
MKKILVPTVLLLLIAVSFSGCFGSNENNENNPSSSKYYLQCIYYNNASKIFVKDLPLNDTDILKITNETFSIDIFCKEFNKSIEYKINVIEGYLIVDFDKINLNPRLEIGYIKENQKCTIDFNFNINSNNSKIRKMILWGNANKISAAVQYDHITGLHFEYLENYNNTSWNYSNNADIILKFPYFQQFGIYLSPMED